MKNDDVTGKDKEQEKLKTTIGKMTNKKTKIEKMKRRYKNKNEEETM